MSACQEPQAAAPKSTSAATNAPTVVFHTASGDVHIRVELAVTEEERQKGLMHRRHLPAGEGMLFWFPQNAVHSFWMKNTLIPLDMIHLDVHLNVVGVVADAEPLTLTPRRIERPSRLVVEINGGASRELGITEGTEASLLHVPAELRTQLSGDNPPRDG